jgi:hypothetical protein
MKINKSTVALAAVIAVAAFGTTAAIADDGNAAALQDRSIGFVLTNKNIATYQSPDGKTECPQGVNDGPREQFKTLYPEDGTHRTFVGTQLEREGQVWNPTLDPEPKLPFKEVQSKIAIGLNLDGKVGPNDFTSPTGEKGIDNQMYRIVGCVGNYRGPDGAYRHFVEEYMQKYNFNRFLVELTDVDSLANDNDVTVTLYRGRDPLTVDAKGSFTSGGTQRVDYRWGKMFIYRMHAKIENGVLTTEPTDVTYPESMHRGVGYLSVRAWRLHLNLTPEGAVGLMAGYTDIERFYNSLGQNQSTHHRSYGQESMPSEYRELRKLADGYPDPQTGANTAISTAWEVRFSQAFILKDQDKTVAQAAAGTEKASRH